MKPQNLPNGHPGPARAACLLLLSLPLAMPPLAPAQGSPPTAAAAPIKRLSDDAPAGQGEPARYIADAKWQIAGYNDQEIVYTILITSQDTRIIHCSAELHGFYFENGARHSISDRQGTTIFPGRQVSVGHWLGMDQQSGATYKVSCKAM